MLSKVEENVDEGIAYFRWGRQGTRVVTTAPHFSRALPGTVDRICSPAGEPLKAANQRFSRRRLDDEVQVVGLDGEVSEAKAATARACERGGHCSERGEGAKRRDVRDGPDRDVNRMAGVVRGTSDVPLLRSQCAWFTTRAGAAASPARW